jgi:hypothetical protein
VISNLLLFASLALAQDFKNVQQGQPAPFSGTLLKPEAMATIFATHDAQIAECKADSVHEIEKQDIKCELEIQKIEYDFNSYKIVSESIIAEKDKELDKAYELLKTQPQNKTPMWIGVGFVGGLATSIGMIYLYEEITK